MKKCTTLIMVIGLLLCIMTSCSNSGNNNVSEKELALQKKELELKQKELELKEKELNQKDSISKMQSTKPTVTNSTNKSEQSGGYNFDNHGDIKVFIDDLSKATNSGDKNSIAQMINFPLKDVWGDNPGNQTPSLRCNNSTQFLEKYDKIFTSSTKKSIKSKKYRGYSTNSINGDVIEQGEYLIENDMGMYMLGIKKINGKYKIYALKFYS